MTLIVAAGSPAGCFLISDRRLTRETNDGDVEVLEDGDKWRVTKDEQVVIVASAKRLLFCLKTVERSLNRSANGALGGHLCSRLIPAGLKIGCTPEVITVIYAVIRKSDHFDLVVFETAHGEQHKCYMPPLGHLPIMVGGSGLTAFKEYCPTEFSVEVRELLTQNQVVEAAVAARSLIAQYVLPHCDQQVGDELDVWVFDNRNATGFRLT